MMGFTADGQADADMVVARDKRVGASSQDLRKDRADIQAPPIDPGADAWQKGQAFQLTGPGGEHHSLPPKP